MNRSLKSTILLLVLAIAFTQGARTRLPSASDSRLTQYRGPKISIVAIKQVGDSILIQTIGAPVADSAPTGLSQLLVWPPLDRRGRHDDTSTTIRNDSSLREGVIPIAEFRVFWDSLERLGFWRLNNAYRALASRSDEVGGEFSVSFETYDHRTTTKAVRFFAPESCSPEFRRVYALFENMARYAKSVPGWRVLLSYETAEPIEGLKDWYHAEALQAIIVERDSQGLDTLLSMLMRNDERATAVVWGLGNIDSSLAVATLGKLLARLEAAPLSAGRDSLALHASKILVEIDSSLAVATLEKLLARLEAAPLSAGRDSLALRASKILVQVNGRQGVPAVRRYLTGPHDRLLVGDWCTLLAGVGDYSVVPQVVEMLSDSSRARGVYVNKAAMALQQSGYSSRTVISALFRQLEREMKGGRRSDWGTVGRILVAINALTGEEFRYDLPDSPENTPSPAGWLKWWEANAKHFPVAPGSGHADAYGSIQVNSKPPGAAIRLDAAATAKTTPFLLLNVPVGRHELRLTKEGYASWPLSVTVTQARATTVDAAMVPAFGHLQVNSSPSGAAISLDGANTGEHTPHLFAAVTQGYHDIGLTKKRYTSWDSTVLVVYAQTTTASAKLRSMADSLWITYVKTRAAGWVNRAMPERAVRFGVDSEFGYPLRITKVSAAFQIESEDLSFRFRIYKGDGRTLLYESPVLEALPDRPTVHELSNPISVDSGEFYVSVAPIDTSGRPSSICQTAAAHGKAPGRRSYAGRPGQWSPIMRDELAIAVLVRRNRYGSIRVNSTPSGAAIWLDTTNTGEATPHVFSDVPVRDYSVLLTKKGYADWHSNVAVAQDQPAEVNATLAEQPSGSLQVNSTPAGTVITLDGVNTGRRTPYLFTNVAAGSHRLALRGVYRLPPRGDQPGWDSTVKVIEGQTTVAEASLKAPPESLWATYASPADIDYGAAWGVRSGLERVVKFNPHDFGFDYPVKIRKLRATFGLGYFPWPDSSFRFRIFGKDGLTLLYESPVLEAIPGNAKGPAVVHEMSAPILVDSGDFYVAVAPLDTNGVPPSVIVWGLVNGTPGAIPGPPRNPNGRSYTGSPGHWSRLDDGEFLISAQLQR